MMKSERDKWIRFGIALAMIGFTWGIVLPMVASQSAMSEHIEHQKRLKIDPSAVFYTELEVTPGIVNHMERMNESHSDLFWGRTSSADSGLAKSDHDEQ